MGSTIHNICLGNISGLGNEKGGGGGRWTKIIMLNYFWLSLVIWSWAFNLYLMSCWVWRQSLAQRTQSHSFLASGGDKARILRASSHSPVNSHFLIELQIIIVFSSDRILSWRLSGIPISRMHNTGEMERSQSSDLSANSQFQQLLGGKWLVSGGWSPDLTPSIGIKVLIAKSAIALMAEHSGYKLKSSRDCEITKTRLMQLTTKNSLLSQR